MNTPAHRRLLRHAVYASLLALPFVAAGACASSDTAYDYQAEQAPLETATGPASWPTTHVLVDPSVRDACGVHEANAAFELDTAKISDTANRNLGDLADCQRGPGVHGAGQEIDLADLEQLLCFLRSDGRIGFAVFEDQFELAAKNAAAGVDFLRRKFEAPAHALADACIGAGQWRQDANLDGLLRLRGRRNKRRHRNA